MYGLNPDDFTPYKILGSNVQVILDGFGSFTLLASKIMAESGLGTPDKDGLVKLVPTEWYSVPAFMRAWERIQAEFGDYTLKQAGRSIPTKATTATDTQLSDIDTAFNLLDASYLINHTKNGVRMFNPETGEMMEGIGHYRTKTGPGKNQITVDVNCPYPCAFAGGVIEGLAQMFDPKAKMTHDPKACRKHDSPICTFVVSYNMQPSAART
jgi:hypothetical protein